MTMTMIMIPTMIPAKFEIHPGVAVAIAIAAASDYVLFCSSLYICTGYRTINVL